jgi:hypothetical protein
MTYFPEVRSLQQNASAAINSVPISAGATLTLSFAPGARETSCAVNLNQNCLITVGAGVAGVDQLMTVDLIQQGTGGWIPSFANVSWPGGISPGFNLAPGKQDTIQLRAVGSDIMGWPVSMGRLPLLEALPTAPATIAVTAGVNQNSINASPVQSYPPVSGYNIYAGAAAGLESAVPIASNVSLPFVESGLSAGVSRFYRVAAVNSIGVGAMSQEASGTPTASGAIPAAPTSVTAVGSAGQVTVSAAAVSASPAVTGYTIRRGTSASGEGTTPIAANVALPFVDTNVINGTSYYYVVAAVNALGTGPYSAEASATPAAPATTSPSHYAVFAATDCVVYASPNPLFNPGGSPFDVQIHVWMANWSTSGYGSTAETCLWGCWDVNVANRLWRLGLTATGAIRASWATGSASDATAISSVPITAPGGSDLWIRAAVTPTTGLVAFYTSTDGNVWTQLGTQQTASSSGAVYTPATLPYLVIGSNASGGSSGNTAEQFAGRFYEARLYINGLLVTDPTVGPGGVTDSKGIGYLPSASVGLV